MKANGFALIAAVMTVGWISAPCIAWADDNGHHGRMHKSYHRPKSFAGNVDQFSKNFNHEMNRSSKHFNKGVKHASKEINYGSQGKMHVSQRVHHHSHSQ